MTITEQPATVISTLPKARIESITPDMAKEYLRRNTRNRTPKPKHFTKMCRDMLAGQWSLNGEAVKIATDGTILDGQNRLLACIEAGVPFTTFLITDLPLVAQKTMDSGVRRTFSDVLTIEGEQYTRNLASILRNLWLIDIAGDRKLSGNQVPTVSEQMALLAERPEIRRSAQVAGEVWAQFRDLRPSAVGAAHHLCMKVSTEQAPWFFARLADGAEMPVNHPVMALRRRALHDRNSGRQIATATQIAYIARAWNHFRADSPITVIKHPAGADIPLLK